MKAKGDHAGSKTTDGALGRAPLETRKPLTSRPQRAVIYEARDMRASCRWEMRPERDGNAAVDAALTDVRRCERSSYRSRGRGADDQRHAAGAASQPVDRPMDRRPRDQPAFESVLAGEVQQEEPDEHRH